MLLTIMEFITDYNLTGLLLGLCSFLIIGLFHPLVVKGEYYLGVRCWWGFLVLGIAAGVCSVLADGFFVQTLLGVLAFSSFWSILEVFEQRERVRKGWFPANPRRQTEENRSRTEGGRGKAGDN